MRIMRPGWASPHAAARAVAAPANVCGDMRRALHASPSTHVRPSCPRHEQKGPVFTGQSKGSSSVWRGCVADMLPLRAAEAQRNLPEEIQQLIAGGVDPSTANGVGQTALHVACLWGTHKCVEVLIKAGAQVRDSPAASGPGRAASLRISPHAPMSHPSLTQVCAHGMSPHHR
jgi:hypothetical protein